MTKSLIAPMSRVRRLAFLVATVLCSGPALAWSLFGPKSFDECVLEKMKGQDQRMLTTVRKVCEKEFPVEKLIPWKEAGISAQWSMQQWNHAVGVAFDDSTSRYRVTTIKLVLFKHSCSSDALPGEVLVVEFSDIRNQKSFLHKLPTPTYFSCGEINLFGFSR